MSVIENRTLRLLREGKHAIGFGVRYLSGATPSLMAAAAGFDWLFIDTECGHQTISEARQTAMAALKTGVTPIVRVCHGALTEATRLLDNGAMGIIVPHVSTEAEAREIAGALRYRPIGHRGWAGAQPSFGYAKMPMLEAQAAINEQVIVVVMIETPEGVANADAIAAVEGIDVLLMGTSDLTVEMGIGGQLEHPDLLAAFERVGAACAKAGKFMGVAGLESDDALLRYAKMGARFAIVGGDHGMLVNGTRQRCAQVRNLLKAVD